MSLPRIGNAMAAGSTGKWVRAVRPAKVANDVAVAPMGRDARLDMFRGIALVMIFINHVPGTIYENLTNRNFGFSDAAEAFVFMSGMAAGLAYSNGFRKGHLWLAIAKVWARARQLFFVHITITMLCLAIFAAAALWFDLPEVMLKNNIAPIYGKPLSTLVGIPTLGHQLGYLNILPLYTLLLLATPAFLLIGIRRPWLLFGLSIALWALAGQFRLNIPSFPNSGGWFFNPFSWQVLYIVGLLSGAAMKSGKTFIPYHPALFALAAALIVVVLIWVKVPQVGDVGRYGLAQLSKIGAPFYITWFDKTFLALPRLLHALALFYVLSYLPIMRPIAASPIAAPFRVLGRQGLAVFAAGTVISMFLQVVKTPREPEPLFDGLILGGGLLALLTLAWVLTRTAELRTAARANA